MMRPWFQIPASTPLQRVLVFAALFSLRVFIPGAESAEPPKARGLFLEASSPKSAVATRPTITRRRVVTIDAMALRAQKIPGGRLSFNLFADADYEGVVEKVVERGEEDFTLTGTLAGQKLSSFALAMKDGVAVMNIRTPNRGM